MTGAGTTRLIRRAMVNGTVNGATWTTAGKNGGALSFNGSSGYVDLGNASGCALTGSATWSAWVFATGTPADDGQIIAKSGGNGAAGWQLKTARHRPAHLRRCGLAQRQRRGAALQQDGRSFNTWYYVAGVYDAAARTSTSTSTAFSTTACSAAPSRPPSSTRR